MWNRSRQGIQLTKQRLRDKLLAGPTSCSYFTEALLSIGEKKRLGDRGKKNEREGGKEGERERGRIRGMARERTTENVSAKQHEFMDEQFYLVSVEPSCSRSFGAHQPCVYASLLYPFAHLRQQGRTKVTWLVCTPNGRHYELSLHPKYRTGRQRRPFSAFFSPHFFLDLHRFSNPQLEKHWSTLRFLIAVVYLSALNYRSVEPAVHLTEGTKSNEIHRVFEFRLPFSTLERSVMRRWEL